MAQGPGMAKECHTHKIKRETSQARSLWILKSWKDRAAVFTELTVQYETQ